MAGVDSESTLQTIRENKECCDFLIKIGTLEFPVHKCFLMSGSEYFRRMFASGMREATEGVVEVQGADEEAVRVCVDFMYDVQPSLTMENVGSIMYVANMWQIERLMKKCSSFLNENIGLETCFRVKNLAVLYVQSALQQKCESFISENMKRLVQVDWREVVKADFICYIEMMKLPGKHHTSCDTLWKLLEIWGSASQQNMEEFCDVMMHLPIKDCPISFIQADIWENTHLINCQKCKEYVAGEVLDHFAGNYQLPAEDRKKSLLINKHNCFFLKSLADDYENIEGKKIVTEFFRGNLQILSKESEFGKISKDDFLLYVGPVDLDIFAQAIAKWIRHDEGPRKAEFDDILPCYQELMQLNRDKVPGVYQVRNHSPKAWFAIKAFAKRHGCQKIEAQSDDLILAKFDSIFEMEEFKALDKNDLLNYVGQRNLNDIPRTWEAVVSWINHDKENREDCFPTIFKSLNFDHAPADFLKNVVAVESLVQSTSASKDALTLHLIAQVSRLQVALADNTKDVVDLNLRLSELKRSLFFPGT